MRNVVASQRVWRLVFVLALAVCVYLALRPAGDKPAMFPHIDKLEHALAFATLAVLGWWAGWAMPVRLFVGLALFGIGIEFAQSFTATRMADVWDALADMAGAALALWVLARRQQVGPSPPAHSRS